MITPESIEIAEQWIRFHQRCIEVMRAMEAGDMTIVFPPQPCDRCVSDDYRHAPECPYLRGALR